MSSADEDFLRWFKQQQGMRRIAALPPFNVLLTAGVPGLGDALRSPFVVQGVSHVWYSNGKHFCTYTPLDYNTIAVHTKEWINKHVAPGIVLIPYTGCPDPM